MSIQFGRWNFEGQPLSPDYIEKVSATLAAFRPDSDESYSESSLKILYRAFYTTKESRREKQPCISSSGAVLTWDGRLDNRADLISELGSSDIPREVLSSPPTDAEIVAAAYDKWNVNCLGKLIGDWALAIWNPRDRSVLLAKDPIGIKHLYYALDKQQITWSTVLDPLVLLAGKTFEICEEYIAGWFALLFPATHLTPYVGIHSVPPSSYVILQPEKQIVGKYWDFDPQKKVRYPTDAEYEEHFRSVFEGAVQRRLRSDRPVLAELSGGVDSSSIVCMADSIISRAPAENPRLDTVTWYDDANPNWGERQHFTRVEAKRGRIGHHIDLGAHRRTQEGQNRSRGCLVPDGQPDRIATIPGSSRLRSSELFKQYGSYMRSQQYRVTISGIGGEEACGGGVPTPRPELQDLMARGRFPTLFRQANAWSVKMGKPRLPLLREALRGFFFRAPAGVAQAMSPTPWLTPGFVRRNRQALGCCTSRVNLFGALPSFHHHLQELNHVRRFLAYCALNPEWPREIRFPYLDRDLLEFTYAVPHEQLVRVGQRRSLMRRALANIVSEDLLSRRTTRTIPSPEPMGDSSAEWIGPTKNGQRMLCGSIGIVDANRFREALEKAAGNEQVPISSLNRTLMLEAWLGHLATQGILKDSMTGRGNYSSALETEVVRAPSRPQTLAS